MIIMSLLSTAGTRDGACTGWQVGHSRPAILDRRLLVGIWLRARIPFGSAIAWTCPPPITTRPSWLSWSGIIGFYLNCQKLWCLHGLHYRWRRCCLNSSGIISPASTLLFSKAALAPMFRLTNRLCRCWANSLPFWRSPWWTPALAQLSPSTLWLFYHTWWPIMRTLHHFASAAQKILLT